MNGRKILYVICCLSAVLFCVESCKKNSYDFTSSPTSPKVGQKVVFSNISDAGESWLWTFGDGGKSSLKNPTHVFSSTGTFVVELLTDSNKNRKVSHILEVLDSIPTIYVESPIVPQYTPVTLKASYYKPSNTSVTIAWSVDPSLFVLTEGELSGDSIIGYFTDYNRDTEIVMTITIGSKTTEARCTLTLVDNEAPSLIMQAADGTLWRQRLYDGYYESHKPYEGDASVIEPANDSTATLNGVTYDIHAMPVLADKQISALQTDAVNRKLYLIMEDGLYIANANGDALALIVETKAYTLLVDAERNSVYWSDAEGVKVVPLVTNPQNIISEQLRAKIKTVNTIQNVKRMIISQ